jgi:hypothetical protein
LKSELILEYRDSVLKGIEKFNERYLKSLQWDIMDHQRKIKRLEEDILDFNYLVNSANMMNELKSSFIE